MKRRRKSYTCALRAVNDFERRTELHCRRGQRGTDCGEDSALNHLEVGYIEVSDISSDEKTGFPLSVAISHPRYLDTPRGK